MARDFIRYTVIKESYQRDLPTKDDKETYKKDLQKRPIKETYKRDL